MGLTLLESARSEQDLARGAVISELSEGPLLGIMPFRDVEGAGIFYEQEGELPAVGFRGINETADQTYGVMNPQSEALKIFTSEVDVDTALIDFHGPEAKANQIRMKVRSMRMTLEDLFINGNESANPRQFDGLQVRINDNSSQSILQSGGALSLQTLDELSDTVDAAGGQKVFLMNKTMRRRLTAASRSTSIGGFITYSQDQFGRRVEQFGDIPIITMDTNAQNQQILPFTESGSTCSIYCVALGDLLTTMIQGRNRGTFGVSIRELGEVPDAPVDRTRIEWYVGAAIFNGRSAARLRGVTNAPVVA